MMRGSWMIQAVVTMPKSLAARSEGVIECASNAPRQRRSVIQAWGNAPRTDKPHGGALKARPSGDAALSALTNQSIAVSSGVARGWYEQRLQRSIAGTNFNCIHARRIVGSNSRFSKNCWEMS